MKTGIFGGTFDPPHIGHLIAAQDALQILGLARVLFVPAGQPPHKDPGGVSPAATRAALIRAAVADDPRFAVSEIELARSGPTYTVDTLRELVAQFPEDEFYLLLGADQVRDLDTWREPDAIATLARIVMVAREGVSRLPSADQRVHRSIEITRIDVSATEIRRRVGTGESIRYLVPQPVESMIADLGLYLDGAG